MTTQNSTHKSTTITVLIIAIVLLVAIAAISLFALFKYKSKEKAETEQSQLVEQAESYLESLPESCWKIGYRVDSEIARVYYLLPNKNDPSSPQEYQIHCHDLIERTHTTIDKCQDGHLIGGYYFNKAVKYDSLIFIQSRWDDEGMLITVLNTNNNVVDVLFEEAVKDDDDVMYTDNEIIINVYYACVYNPWDFSKIQYDKHLFRYEIGTDIHAFKEYVSKTMKTLAEEADERGK